MMDNQQTYQMLGQLIANPPTDNADEARLWLARLYAFANASNMLLEAVRIKEAMDGMHNIGATRAVEFALSAAYRLLAVAEMKAPAAVQGTFVNAASPFDAITAMNKVLVTARQTVRIVDPYMSETVLTDFVLLVSERVRIELLADPFSTKPVFGAAVARFVTQFGDLRPLEARYSSARALHDRILIIDNAEVWNLSQSLKDFGARSPASIVRFDAETSKLKLAAYEQFWQDASPI